MSDQEPKIVGLTFAKVIVWIAYFFFLVATVILTLAFFLLLFNANPDAGFTQWVYRNASRVLEPFRGIFPSVQADSGSVVDFAVIFAIIIYGIMAMLVHSLAYWLDRKLVEQKYKAQQASAAAAMQQSSGVPTTSVPSSTSVPGSAQAAPSSAPTAAGDQSQTSPPAF